MSSPPADRWPPEPALEHVARQPAGAREGFREELRRSLIEAPRTVAAPPALPLGLLAAAGLVAAGGMALLARDRAALELDQAVPVAPIEAPAEPPGGVQPAVGQPDVPRPGGRFVREPSERPAEPVARPEPASAPVAPIVGPPQAAPPASAAPVVVEPALPTATAQPAAPQPAPERRERTERDPAPTASPTATEAAVVLPPTPTPRWTDAPPQPTEPPTPETAPPSP